MPLSSVEEIFSVDPTTERPDRDDLQARWDADLAASYEAIGKTMAFRHATANLRDVREEFVRRLIAGEDGAEAYRQAITVIDLFLKLPGQAAARGAEARDWLVNAGDRHTEE